MNCERDAIHVVVHQKAVWMPPVLKKGTVESETALVLAFSGNDGVFFTS